MKRKLSTRISIGLTILFIIGALATAFIIFKDIRNEIALKFIGVYVIFIFVYIIGMILITIFNLRFLKRTEIRKRLVRFFLIFISFATLNVLLTYLIKGEFSILDHLDTAFGMSFGITFIDVLFMKKKEEL